MRDISKAYMKRTAKKERFERGLNSRPSACKADVITATPSNRRHCQCVEQSKDDR